MKILLNFREQIGAKTNKECGDPLAAVITRCNIPFQDQSI